MRRVSADNGARSVQHTSQAMVKINVAVERTADKMRTLAKRSQDGTLEVSETVKSAGRTLLNYVSRNLTARSGCTMRALRNSRIVWAWREGRLPDHGLTEWDFIVASCLLDRLPVPMRGP